MIDSDQDQALGLRVNEIEAALLEEARAQRPQGNHHTWGHYLHQGKQTWVGLDPQTLQTPYHELKKMLLMLNPPEGSLFVDLGAGYGRLGFVLKDLYPKVCFIGFEYVSQRVLEGRRVMLQMGMDPERLIIQDLSALDFKLPQADFYFLYDYGNVMEIRKTLNDLEKFAEQKDITIVARGKGVRSIIDYEHPWLTKLYNVYHDTNFSIYTRRDLDNYSQAGAEGL